MKFVVVVVVKNSKNVVLINQNKMEEIKNGDVFDIEQTINGVSKFLWFNNKWYYFEERMTYEYQYNQEDLTKTVIDNDSNMVTFLGNILDAILTN
jgi:hypothetical protein